MSTPSQTPAKMNKQSRIIVLTLQPDLLAQFLPKTATRKDSKAKSSTPSTSIPKSLSITAPVTQTSSTENASETNSTPVPNTDDAVSTDLPKKNVTKGPKSGSKRGLGQGTESMPKPRGKPGPKKKPRLEDGTIDHGGVKTPYGGIVPLATHKLGPKANQGAINAGLRALDRSGKPCRKWERKAFQVKSFTGVVWELPSWRAPRSQLNGDESSDGMNPSQQSASNSKANDSSTAAESAGGDIIEADTMMLSTPAASSPVPMSDAVAVDG